MFVVFEERPVWQEQAQKVTSNEAGGLERVPITRELADHVAYSGFAPGALKYK